MKKVLQGPKIDADEAFMQQYEVDRRSIYIGNLPYNEAGLEDQIRALVDEMGDVVSVQVIQKEGRNGEFRQHVLRGTRTIDG